MTEELVIIAEHILKAQHVEDVFGENNQPNVAGKKKHLKHTFWLLAKKVHEDLFPQPADKELAKRATQQLYVLREKAESKVLAGTYGDRTKNPVREPEPEVSVKGKSEYIRCGDFATGDIADLHNAYYMVRGKKVEVLLKFARDFQDNELLETERNVLEDLRSKFADAKSVWGGAIPKIIDSFRVDDGTAKKRRMNVLEKFSGFYTVEQIRQLMPGGVDGRTIAWMWKRLILMIDWTYRLGYVHGAVLPPHILFYPDNDGCTTIDPRKHSIRLVDWCYAKDLKGGAKLKAWVPAYEQYYAPEVLAKKTLGPATDLYMGAKTMVYLVGGDPAKNQIPSHIPTPIATSILKCLERDYAKRPQDPQAYLNDFTRTLERVYGKPKYHDFILPK